MKILKGDKGNIDFQHPLRLDRLQRERFINFLKEMFYYVEEKEVKEFRDKRIGEKNFQREWDEEEYILLLTIDENTDSISRKLGRSWMSIIMRRLELLPGIMGYAAKKGVDIYKVDMKQLVHDFLNENREKMIRRKEMRKNEKRKQKEEEKEYSRLKEEIPKDEKLIGVSGFSITQEKIDEKKRRFEELKNKFKDVGGDE